MHIHHTRTLDTDELRADSTQELLFRGMDFVPIPLLVSEAISLIPRDNTSERKHRFFNKSFSEKIGYSVEEMPNIESYFDLSYPDAEYRTNRVQDWNTSVQTSLQKGLATAQTRSLVRCKNGEYRWFHITAELHSATLPNCHMVAFLDIHDLTVALEENSRLSRTDELTGLPNRREAQSSLDNEWLRFQRTGTAFSVLLCDIDYFKQVNDQRGHLVGDMALRAVAAQLTQCCRTIDCVSRWGGEEFLIVLPQTDLTQATELAERMRMSIADLVIDTDSRPLSLRLSIGCTTVQPGQSVQTLLGQADKALYAAKEAGRNRVCVG